MKRLLITALSLRLLASTVQAMDSDNFGNEPLPHLSLTIGTVCNNSSYACVVRESSRHSLRSVSVHGKEKVSINWADFPIPLGVLTTAKQIEAWKKWPARPFQPHINLPESGKDFLIQYGGQGAILCTFDCARVKTTDMTRPHLFIQACLCALRCKTYLGRLKQFSKSKIWHQHDVEVPSTAMQADIEFAFDLGEKSGGVQSMVVFTDAKGARSTHKSTTSLQKKFLEYVHRRQEPVKTTYDDSESSGESEPSNKSETEVEEKTT